ncbi:replicative DNA helicase [Microvirga arsenatis]|uniref:DNA 5'-3' helicase n=1 Tax=Microvirga arsenatis TaxID=2692265 RepID=A0ABW9YV23_9HYPH|nr:DnaB-like helicase C-terminal domain-containing protein [Microvirga arsenatis]NBJ13320.1 AAA family ATPase [Microvirga arsenatis]NBJ24104.1 AAA family ATPase [Microvirga arsenatis]
MRPETVDYIEQPHALSAEQGLLGAILHNTDVIDRVRGIVEADDFHEQVNATIFRTMCERRDAGENIDGRLVRIAIGDQDLGGITVGEYLARLYAHATTVSNAPDYARAIRHAAMMRKLLAACRDGVAAMTSGAVQDPSRYAAQMIEELDLVATSGTHESLKRVTLGSASQQAIDAAVAAREGRLERGAPYGIPSLDRMTLGMRPGQMIVLAGRPGMGKTTVGVALALNAAKAGHGVYFVSLEMVAQELGERALAAAAFSPRDKNPISYREIAKGKDLSDEDIWALQETQKRLSKLPLVIEQQPGLTISQIAARARQARASMERKGIPLSVVVIDHLGLIKATGRYSGNRVQELTEITGAIKVLAKELNAAVLVLSQLSRETEKREDKRPVLSDLRDSGSTEQDADMVMGLYREAYYLEHKANPTPEDLAKLEASRDVIEIEILKQRQGPTGRARLFCAINCNAVSELSEY